MKNRTPARRPAHERRARALLGATFVGAILLLAAPMAAADHAALDTPLGPAAAHAEGTSAQASAALGAGTGMVPVSLPVAGGASSSLSISASPGGATIGASGSGGASGISTGASGSASVAPPPVPDVPAKTTAKGSLLGQAFEWFISLF